PDASSTADITVNVAANVASDAAGNNNTAATQSMQPVDTAVPTVAITDDTTGTATGDVTYTCTFSEDVTGFTADDISVSGGTKGTFTAVSGSVYTLVVTPDASSTANITVNVAANVASDAAGNNNTAATQSTQPVDTAIPSVAISDDTPGTATGDVTYTFTFSEDVTGFTADDITVSGGTKGTFTAVSGSVYTLVVTPDASSTADITVNVAANVASDAAGNNNTAATQSTQPVDTAIPSVAISDDTPGTATGDVTYTFTFSEDVTGFTADDITVSGGTKGTFTAVSGSVYTLVVTPDASSTADITVNVAANVASDAAGNNNTAATQSTQPVDTAIPSVVISDDTTGTATGDVTYTFTFSESVTGFTADDISVSGGTKGTFTAVSGSVYTLVVTPDASSTANITVNVAANMASDAAGNNNTAATQSTQAVDTVVPSVTITSDKTSLKTDETATITIELSEASSDFNIGGISVTGGELSNFVSTSATHYSALFTPTADSETNATLDINADSFTDAAGNGNTAATQLVLTVDTQAPSGHSVVIDQALINRGNEAALSFTLSGLESAGSFTYQISDGTNSVSGASPVAVDAVSEQVTGLDVSSLDEGTLTLSVVVSDEAGNAAASISATVVKKYNVAPQLSGSPATTVNEDVAYSFTPTLTDPDQGDTHTYSIENKPDWA
ncbi:beta strand repeat-containing protein, partial [Photobacterium proteolyticum]|uniref:beta strand repeat-containing protein n=1 Tax=Photobacterium proteolyticum TaxID=1903952 RepID=UPI000B1510B1